MKNLCNQNGGDYMFHKQLWTIIVVSVALYFFLPVTVFGASDEAKVEPKEVQQGGITVQSEQFDYSHYEAVSYVGGDWNPFTIEEIDKGMNGIANIIFTVTKTFSSLVDIGLEQLYGLNIINGLADQIGNVSEDLWKNLKDDFGAILLVLAVLQIFAFYVGQRNSSKAGSATFKLIMIVMVSVIWFSNSGYFLKVLNNWSNEAQSSVMSVGTLIADEKVEEGKELEGSQGILRNKFFELTVFNPYLIMNYGTTNEKTILKDNENRIDNLLSYRKNEAGYKKRSDIAKTEVEDLNNMAMSSSNIPNKVGIAFISLLFVFLLGLPLLAIALVNLILQMLALAIAVILPLSFIISFLPSFANSGWYTLGKLISVFLMKVFVGVLLLFTFLVINITEGIIPTDSIASYMLNVLVTGILMILMIAKRDKIIDFITAGRVASVDGGMAQAQQAYQNIKKPKEKNKEKTNPVSSKNNVNSEVVANRRQMQNRKNERSEQKETSNQDTGTGKRSHNPLKSRNTTERTQQPHNKNSDVVDLASFKESRNNREDQQGENQKASEPMPPSEAKTQSLGTVVNSHSNDNRNKSRNPQRSSKEKNNGTQHRTDKTKEINRKNRNPQQSLKEKEKSTNKKDNRSTKSNAQNQLNRSNRNSQQKEQKKPKQKEKPITKWEANQQVLQNKSKRRSQNPSKEKKT